MVELTAYAVYISTDEPASIESEKATVHDPG
jgi:hypothetical protein